MNLWRIMHNASLFRKKSRIIKFSPYLNANPNLLSKQFSEGFEKYNKILPKIRKELVFVKNNIKFTSMEVEPMMVLKFRVISIKLSTHVGKSAITVHIINI